MSSLIRSTLISLFLTMEENSISVQETIKSSKVFLNPHFLEINKNLCGFKTVQHPVIDIISDKI